VAILNIDVLNLPLAEPNSAAYRPQALHVNLTREEANLLHRLFLGLQSVGATVRGRAPIRQPADAIKHLLGRLDAGARHLEARQAPGGRPQTATAAARAKSNKSHEQSPKQ